MTQFICYTVGLECWINGAIKIVKCEYSRTEKGVIIHAVSGNNLGRIGGLSRNISIECFKARPKYYNTAEAIWALNQIGLTPAAIDREGQGK